MLYGYTIPGTSVSGLIYTCLVGKGTAVFITSASAFHTLSPIELSSSAAGNLFVCMGYPTPCSPILYQLRRSVVLIN